MKAYIICTTPRTGSYLLCDGLKGSGVAGRPTEFFSPGFRGYWSKKHGFSDYESFLRWARRIGTTENGVFGVKAHGRQFRYFLQEATGRGRVPADEQRAVLETWLPEASYVWLRRRDKVRQVVSYLRALQTQVWWDADAPPAPFDAPRPDAAKFSFATLEAWMDKLGEEDDLWRHYFAANEIDPLVLYYEDLSRDYEGTVRRVLDYLTLPQSGVSIPPPGLRRQTDGVTVEWVDRFERLREAKNECTLSAFAGMHKGETLIVASNGVPSLMPQPGPAVIAVGQSERPSWSDYAVVDRRASRDTGSAVRPRSDVVFLLDRGLSGHPFSVRIASQTGADGVGRVGKGWIDLPEGPCHPLHAGVLLAAWMGASTVALSGIDRWKVDRQTRQGGIDRLHALADRLASDGVRVIALERSEAARFPVEALEVVPLPGRTVPRRSSRRKGARGSPLPFEFPAAVLSRVIQPAAFDDASKMEVPRRTSVYRVAGVAGRVRVLYEESLGTQGRDIASSVLRRSGADLEALCRWLGPLPPGRRIGVHIADLPNGVRAFRAGNDGRDLFCDVQTTPSSNPNYTSFLASMLIVDHVAAPEWIPGSVACEALSRCLAAALHPSELAGFATAWRWLDSDRQNLLTATELNGAAVGCAVAFLHYLHGQLGYSWSRIAASGGTTVRDVYRNVSGSDEDPFPLFLKLLDRNVRRRIPAPTGIDNFFPVAVGAEHGARPARPRRPRSRTSEGTQIIKDAPESSDERGEWLQSRRWLWCGTPFPHVRAGRVLEPGRYEAVDNHFRRLLSSGSFSPDIPGYDVDAVSITEENAGPLSLFLSRRWHDMLSALFDEPATGEVIVSLHHHRPGSPSGVPHNDLNPGWFVPRPAGDDRIRVHDARDCRYRDGVVPRAATDKHAVERTRAVAVIYYLANPPYSPGSGGETGLYRSGSDPVSRPGALVPPYNNSMVAFPCTPYSFHAFISNRVRPRNSLVMWLHRTKEETVARFGEASIVGW